jgi:hypothetical protein
VTKGKYPSIKRTPTFIAAYADLREYLRRSSPMAYIALPSAMETVFSVINMFPKGWPNRRSRIADQDVEFRVAIVNIAYRRLHVRYLVSNEEPVVCRLVAVWVDGHDEPSYQMD